MNTSTSAFTKFLDEKYIPLDLKPKVAIGIVIILLPIVAFYFALYSPNKDKITGMQKQKVTLERELREVKEKASHLAEFIEELKKAEELFNETAVLLPKEKEIPQLLRDISALGRNAGLDFLTFKPLADIPKDFYSEIPISINVRGPFHNMGYFFDQVSKLERIVTVANVNMSSPKKEAGEMLLKSDCTLTTYRFTNIELPKEPKK